MLGAFLWCMLCGSVATDDTCSGTRGGSCISRSLAYAVPNECRRTTLFFFVVVLMLWPSSGSPVPSLSRYLSYSSPLPGVTTIAGSPPPQRLTGTADGVGTTARFRGLRGACYSQQRSAIVVLDYSSQRIREVRPSMNNLVTTIAGSGCLALVDNDNGSLACFNFPPSCVVDNNISSADYGVMYVADNDNSAVRLVYPNNSVKTMFLLSNVNIYAVALDPFRQSLLVGLQGVGLVGAMSLVNKSATSLPVIMNGFGTYIYDIVVDVETGIAYISDGDRGQIRVLLRNGTAGGSLGGSALRRPAGLLLVRSVGVLVAEYTGHRLTLVCFNGSLRRVAGNGSAGFVDAPPERNSDVRLNAPYGLAAAETPSGAAVYFTEFGNYAVRKLVFVHSASISQSVLSSSTKTSVVSLSLTADRSPSVVLSRTTSNLKRNITRTEQESSPTLRSGSVSVLTTTRLLRGASGTSTPRHDDPLPGRLELGVASGVALLSLTVVLPHTAPQLQRSQVMYRLCRHATDDLSATSESRWTLRRAHWVWRSV